MLFSTKYHAGSSWTHERTRRIEKTAYPDHELTISTRRCHTDHEKRRKQAKAILCANNIGHAEYSQEVIGIT